MVPSCPLVDTRRSCRRAPSLIYPVAACRIVCGAYGSSRPDQAHGACATDPDACPSECLTRKRISTCPSSKRACLNTVFTLLLPAAAASSVNPARLRHTELQALLCEITIIAVVGNLKVPQEFDEDEKFCEKKSVLGATGIRTRRWQPSGILPSFCWNSDRAAASAASCPSSASQTRSRLRLD